MKTNHIIKSGRECDKYLFLLVYLLFLLFLFLLVFAYPFLLTLFFLFFVKLKSPGVILGTYLFDHHSILVCSSPSFIFEIPWPNFLKFCLIISDVSTF